VKNNKKYNDITRFLNIVLIKQMMFFFPGTYEKCATKLYDGGHTTESSDNHIEDTPEPREVHNEIILHTKNLVPSTTNTQTLGATDGNWSTCLTRLTDIERRMELQATATSRIETKLNKLLIEIENIQQHSNRKVPGPASTLQELDSLLQNDSLVSN
jgi:hypothetical protein